MGRPGDPGRSEIEAVVAPGCSAGTRAPARLCCAAPANARGRSVRAPGEIPRGPTTIGAGIEPPGCDGIDREALGAQHRVRPGPWSARCARRRPLPNPAGQRKLPGGRRDAALPARAKSPAGAPGGHVRRCQGPPESSSFVLRLVKLRIPLPSSAPGHCSPTNCGWLQERWRSRWAIIRAAGFCIWITGRCRRKWWLPGWIR